MLFILLFPLFSLAQKSTVTETIGGKKYYIHTVEKDQTLYSISKIYSTTVNDIVIENPEAIDGIKSGQKLKILFVKAPASSSTHTTSVTTLTTTATTHSTSATTTVTPVVKIFSREDSIKYFFVRIEKGQTLYSLSKQYSVSTNDIQKANPEVKDGLKEGHVLKILRNKANANTIKVDSVKVAPVIIAKTDSVIYTKKSEYNVALFLPFNLSSAELLDVDKIAKGDASFSAKTEVALAFYQGLLLAVDSLKNEGLCCKLFVYDIDENDSTALVNILKKDEMKKMDLIIGPLYSSNVKDVTKFANENKISNVSPLSQLNKILFNNTYTSKTVPSTITQVEQMTYYVAEKYSKENLILVGSRKDVASYTSMKKIMNEKMTKDGSSDTIKVAASLSAATSMLTAGKKNVILFPSNDQAYVTDFMTKLYNSANKFDITVFGMSSWRGFDNMDPTYMDTLHVHTPSVFFVDYSDSITKNFIKKYRSKYLSDPESFAFQGYDVGMFYLGQLKEKGANFHQGLDGVKFTGLQTSFSFYKTAEGSGYDNNKVFVLKQRNHQLIRVE